MKLHDQKKDNTQNSAASNNVAGAIQLQDNRPSSSLQKKQPGALNNLPGDEAAIQKKENNTGLPENIKTGVENLSGIAMDDVTVHYNSAKPAQLNAHAYAQGSSIHIAPGQEKHLPHEAWHVVQQKQGRVKPTLQMKSGVPVNDDRGLEKEADAMGAKALNINRAPAPTQFQRMPVRLRTVNTNIQLSAMLPNAAVKRLSPLMPRNNTVQLLGWTSLGRLNPRRYLPEWKGIGYSAKQMEEPQNRLDGGPMASLGRLNPRLYLPEWKGLGYSQKQMMEPQNYLQGPLSLLGRANPRLHLPKGYGRYSDTQMTENFNAGDKKMTVKGSNPLEALGREHWWKLFMDKKFHDRPENKHEPGMFFDKDKSPGYYRSMMEAFQKAIIKDRGKKVNYERYTEYHDLVSKYISSGKKTGEMRRLGGKEAVSSFTIPPMPVREEKEAKLTPEKDAELLERQNALAEMKEEKVHDRPLLTGFDKSKGYGRQDKTVSSYVHVPGEKAHMAIETKYPVLEGRLLVNTILKGHYDGNHEGGSRAMIRSIAKTIRALHVGHFFVDGNGRHNIFLLMNKLLVDGGFEPSILPNGPDVFGGLKTVDGLVKDMEEGMGAFRELVKSTGGESKKQK